MTNGVFITDSTNGVRIRADVPLTIRNGYQVRVVSFSGLSDQLEHVALVFDGDSESSDAPLVRLHSQCLTGDVFGSTRCDCGGQLQDAMDRMAQDGGILLYLIQEGRGIGLYNKLDAYKLQIEEGMDTYEANQHIGQPDDARDYKVASEMLGALGISALKLLSNNPDKVDQLVNYGMKVVARVPTEVHVNADNVNYLEAKIKKSGHDIDLSGACCSGHE